MLFNPTELQKTYYNIIEKAHTVCDAQASLHPMSCLTLCVACRWAQMLCDSLHPGQRISDVVKAMVKYIEVGEGLGACISVERVHHPRLLHRNKRTSTALPSQST